jgi:hypothetical protein
MRTAVVEIDLVAKHLEYGFLSYVASLPPQLFEEETRYIHMF